MRTARQQAAKVRRDANRAYDMARAMANPLYGVNYSSIACGIEGDHERCQRNHYQGQPGIACQCECHRPTAQPRSREEM